MNNRTAFIDFVRGLLTINPLERWSPQQAKLHPFITQQKYTGPFVPPMNLKTSSLNRSPAPGTQQQQQAEALSKQRAQAAQANANNAAAQSNFGMSAGQYQHQQHHQHGGHPQQASMYQGANMYAPAGSHQTQPPAYVPQQQGAYSQMVMTQAPQQIPQGYVPQQQQQQQQQQQSLYQQATVRAGRQRASTVEQQGIPASIQRVASHLDPNQPIRLQPSPAYYPPNPDGSVSMADAAAARRRGSRAQQTGRSNLNVIRTLEERTLEEGFMGAGQNQWH